MAPVIEQIRPGVAFAPPAAASWRRAESRYGRQFRTASTYRDWDRQLEMHNDWNRYVASGRKPSLYPGHSMAVHPRNSEHCTGYAVDSPEWVDPHWLRFMREHGWIQTAPNDPTERHHLAYRAALDKFLHTPLSTWGAPIEQDDSMSAADVAALQQTIAELKTFIIEQTAPSQTQLYRNRDSGAIHAVNISTGFDRRVVSMDEMAALKQEAGIHLVTASEEPVDLDAGTFAWVRGAARDARIAIAQEVVALTR